MNKKRKLYDAYFTVEATFIVPMSYLLIILVLQYGFFCYEQSVSVQCCYLAALRAANEWNLSGGEPENYAKSEAEKLLEERYIYPVKRVSNITVNMSGIEVGMDVYMEVLFGVIRGDGIDGWEWRTKKRAERTVPSTYIRKYQMIKNAGGENDGSNQQK